MAKYSRSQRLCDLLFIIFTLVWFLTRLVVYPLVPLYSVAFECREIVGPFQSWYVFLALLCILQFFHVLWFIMILRVAYNALTAGKAIEIESEWVRGRDAQTETHRLRRTD